MAHYRMRTLLTRHAVQWTGNNLSEIVAFSECPFTELDPTTQTLMIRFNGGIRLKLHDYLVDSGITVEGRRDLYPADRNVFETTYELLP